MKPDISEKEKKVYVTLYKKDAPSYAMILLATLLEFVYVVSILDVMPVTFMMGVAVIVNIFLLFLLFTCAVKVNVYEIPWAAVSLIVGGYMSAFVSLCWYPLCYSLMTVSRSSWSPT